MDSRDILLQTFQDNNAHMITASDMREFVNSVYDEKISTNAVVNSLISTSVTDVLSAKQGYLLDLRLRNIEPGVQDNTDNIQRLTAENLTLRNELTTLQLEVNNIKALLGHGINNTINTNANPNLVVQSGIIINAS